MIPLHPARRAQGRRTIRKTRLDGSGWCFLLGSRWCSFLFLEYIGKASFCLLHGEHIYSSRQSCTHLTVDLSVSQWQSVLVVRFFALARFGRSAGCCIAPVGKLGNGSDSCGFPGCDNVNTLKRTRHPECTCTHEPLPLQRGPYETLRKASVGSACRCAHRMPCLFICPLCLPCSFVCPTRWLELSGCHGNESPCPSLCSWGSYPNLGFLGSSGSWGIWGLWGTLVCSMHSGVSLDFGPGYGS